MIIYTYYSFAKNGNMSTQLVFIILRADNTTRANIFQFSSWTSSIIVLSVLEGNAYSLSNEFDAPYIRKDNIEKLLGHRVPITMLTNSESDSMSWSSRLSQPRNTKWLQLNYHAKRTTGGTSAILDECRQGQTYLKVSQKCLGVPHSKSSSTP